MHLAEATVVQQFVRQHIKDPVVEWIIESTFDWDTLIPFGKRRDLTKSLRALRPFACGHVPLYYHGRGQETQQLSEVTSAMGEWVVSQGVGVRDPQIRLIFEEYPVVSLVERALAKQPFIMNARPFFSDVSLQRSIAALYEFVLEDIFQGIVGQKTAFDNPVDALIAVRHWMPIGWGDNVVLLMCGE